MAARVHTVGPAFLAPRSAPRSRCSLRLHECAGVQVEVDGEIVGIGGAKRGDIGCSCSGMGEFLMCVVLIKLVFRNIF